MKRRRFLVDSLLRPEPAGSGGMVHCGEAPDPSWRKSSPPPTPIAVETCEPLAGKVAVPNPPSPGGVQAPPGRPLPPRLYPQPVGSHRLLAATARHLNMEDPDEETTIPDREPVRRGGPAGCRELGRPAAQSAGAGGVAQSETVSRPENLPPGR